MGKITINGKEINLKELKYIDIIELSSIENKKEHLVKLFELSGINKEQLENLSILEGQEVMKAINELNSFGVSEINFQNPLLTEGNK